MKRTLSITILLLFTFAAIAITYTVTRPYQDVAAHMMQLPNGDSIQSIDVEMNKNNINPHDTNGPRIDNIIFTITVKENELTDAEIEALGISIQNLLNSEIQATTDADTSNLIRINMSISPLTETETNYGPAHGYSHYRLYHFETAEFEWSYHPYRNIP